MGIVNRAACALSRRSFLGLLAAMPLARIRGATPADWPDQSLWSPDQASTLDLERRYRADAQVLLLGIPLLHREGVGGGSVLWREFGGSGQGRLLEFSGFSSPERAAGLNRLGFIREIARTSGGGGLEYIYFGLMTASAEESAEQARSALHPTAKEQAYNAIDGRIAGGASESATARFSAPASISGDRCPELVKQAQRALASAEITATRATREASHSFLHALAGLLVRPDGEQGRYIYSGRPYLLRLARTPDGKATAHFRECGMIGGRAEVLRVSGKVRREAGGKETDFRLWIESGTERPLPLRIEYQAKSYLRLMFEAQAG